MGAPAEPFSIHPLDCSQIREQVPQRLEEQRIIILEHGGGELQHQGNRQHPGMRH